MIPSFQRRNNAVVDGGKNLLFPGEFDLQLGGVHVHIHRRGMDGQLQIAHRIAAGHQAAFIGLLQRRRHQLGAHPAAIDVKVLLCPGGAGDLGRRNKAADPDLPHVGGQRQHPSGKILAAGGIDGRQHFAVAGGGKALAPVFDQLESHLGLGNGDLGDDVFHITALGSIFFEKFCPGRHIKEQVADDHGGAHRTAGLTIAGLFAALDGDLHALGIVPGASEQIHSCHRRNGGQCLTTEAQGTNGVQVGLGTHLGGGMAQKGGAHVLGQDALAVIGDPEIGDAAVLDLHRNALGTGIHGVFHQFLDHRAGTFHHLAGGDQVGQLGRHLKDLGHINTPLPAWSVDRVRSAPQWG